MSLRVRTPRSTVRDWRRADREALLLYADNRNVWRNLTHEFPHPYSAADADAWLARVDAMLEPTHWAIEHEGEAVGGIGVRLREGVYAKTAEIGYWLGEPFWGRGLMSEVVAAVAPYAMQRYGLVRLEAPVFAWNPASMRVLEKSGFVREGVLRKSAFKDGHVIDTVVYSRVKES